MRQSRTLSRLVRVRNHDLSQEEYATRFFFCAILMSPTLCRRWTRAEAKAAPAARAPSYNNFKDAYAAGNQALKDRKFDDGGRRLCGSRNIGLHAKGKKPGG